MAGKLSVGVDRTAANSLASMVGGPAFVAADGFLKIAPFALAAIIPIWGMYAGQYLLLLAAPIAILSTFFANPFSPALRLMTYLGYGAFVASCIVVALGWTTAALLLFAFYLPIFTVRTMYRITAQRLLSATRMSEPLFVFLFGHGVCTVRDNTTGREYSGR